MASDLYKNLIDKFLSGLKINSANTDEAVRPDNEVSVVKEELTDAISGNKMYGDMPGLQVEESVADYQEDDLLPEKTAKNEVDPLNGIGVVFYYLINSDMVKQLVLYPHSKMNTDCQFKTIEDVAEYILQKRGNAYNEQDIVMLSKELIILNSDGDETTLDKKTEKALNNINNGSINYVVYNEAKKTLPRGSLFYKNIGLSGEMHRLAETISLDEILSRDTQPRKTCNMLFASNKFSNKNSSGYGDSDFSAAFTAFSEILNILAQMPLTANKPIQSGVKAVNNLLLSGKEISGTDLMSMFYSTQEAVIKSGIGQFNGLSASDVNNIAKISNPLHFITAISGKDNANKYIDNIFLENFRLLISFENAKDTFKHRLNDNFKVCNSDTEIGDIMECLETLKNISFQTITGDDGNSEYIVKYSRETVTVKSVGEAIALTLSLIMDELNLEYTDTETQTLSDNSINIGNQVNATAELGAEEIATLDGNLFEIDVSNIDVQLFQGGIKFNDNCVGKILDDGTFICKTNSQYIIENSASDSLDKRVQLTYTPEGKLKLEKIETLNNEGIYTYTLNAYNGGEIQREFSVTVAENKVISASEKDIGGADNFSEYFYQNGTLAKTVENTNQKDKLVQYPQAVSVKKVSVLKDKTEIYEYSYPENYEYTKTIVIVNNKIGEETVINVNANGIATDNKGYPVNVDKMVQNIDIGEYDSVETINSSDTSYKNFNKNTVNTEIQENEDYGEIKLHNEDKKILGELHYTLSDDGNDILICYLKTSKNHTDINSMLFNEVFKIAEKSDKGVITAFQSKFGNTDKKGVSDLEFYYKMGFQAEEPGTDKLIRKCLTKGVCVPSSLAQNVLLKHVGDITPSKQAQANPLQDICKDLEAFLNYDNYLINVEYKDLFENIENFDNENIGLHINNVKRCINSEVDGNNIKIAIDKGYFSSSKGAEAFETFYKMFTNEGTNSSSDGLGIILTHFDVKNFENAKKRGLIEKLNINNVDHINILAGYTDKQYNQRIKFADIGIEYISDNDDINRLAVKYVKDKTGSSYNFEEIEKILLQVKNPQKISEIVDELIKADNSAVINLLKYTKNPKFVALNLNKLAMLDAKFYSASENIRKSKDFNSELYEYEDVCGRIYPNREIVSILFDIDESGKYSDEQLYEIGIRIDNSNKNFVKKLALSDSITPYEVVKILDNTRFITILNEHPSELNSSQKFEAYNLMSSMSEHLKSICKNCGLDIDSEIKQLSEQFESKYDGIEITGKIKNFNKILPSNNKKAYKAFGKFDFSQYGKEGLPLKYTREEFTRKIEEILSEIPENKQSEILNHFGLTKGIAEGFDGIPNNKPFESKNKELRKIAALVQTEIENFTTKNEIMIEDREVKRVLDGIIQEIPEFVMFIGKKQHGEHAYSVDIHTLKVLQSAISDPLYSELSDSDKVVLKTAILMHDFGKKGGVTDVGHSDLSMKYANVVLNKFDIPEDMKCRILDTIKNHNWFTDFNTGKADTDDIMTMCPSDEEFKIYKIFAKADFSNVNPIFQYYKTGTKNADEFNKYMAERFNKINKRRKI